MKSYKCENCGAELKRDGEYFSCQYCHTTYRDDSIEKAYNRVYANLTSTVKDIVTEELMNARLEKIANCRQNLYRARTGVYIDSKEIGKWSDEILKLNPDDVQATFYSVAAKERWQDLNAFLATINAREVSYFVPDFVDYLTNGRFVEECMLRVTDLIARAFADDSKEYELCQKKIKRAADDERSGIFDERLPRDVFVAYSSKDKERAYELVEYLESNGFSCFIAMRNLAKGVNAEMLYNDRLKAAIDNCRVFALVSSRNSRARNCDAFNIEMRYVRECDIKKSKDQNAAAAHYELYLENHRNACKPRVEYLIEDYANGIYEQEVKKFFGGLTWQKTKEGVCKAVYDYVENMPVEEDVEAELKRKAAESERQKIELEKQRLEIERQKLEFEKQREELEAKRKAEQETRRKTQSGGGSVSDNPEMQAALEYFRQQQAKIKAEEEAKRQEEEIRLQEEKRKTEENEALKKKVEKVLLRDGNKVWFGSTLQSLEAGDSKNQKKPEYKEEPIEWRILEEKDGETLLLSEKILDFNTETNFTGKNLFYLFLTEKEKEIADGNCFILGKEEIEKYLSKEERIKDFTDYAKGRRDEYAKYQAELRKVYYPHNEWWLKGWSYVNDKGVVRDKDASYDEPKGVVPAIWVQMPKYTAEELKALSAEIAKRKEQKEELEKKRLAEETERKRKEEEERLAEEARIQEEKRKAEEEKRAQEQAKAEQKQREWAERKAAEEKRKAEEEAKRKAKAVEEASRKYNEQQAGFDIEKGVLVKYIGKGGDVIIPNNVTSIGKSAFDECANLKSVTIPNSVTSIGDNAFYGCSSLISVDIPNSVVSIGYSAFDGCSNLKNITIPNGITSIEANLFYNCSALTDIKIPDSVTRIENRAFSGCLGLTNIALPTSLKIIGRYAFNRCSNLKSITIPSFVTWIMENAFLDCTDLTSVKIPSSVTNIDADTFKGCSNLTIYAEAAKKPDGWVQKLFGKEKWNPDKRPVVWGHKGEVKSHK